MSRGAIRPRIDAALEKMRAQQVAVRAIYLDPVDLAALDRDAARRFGGGCRIHVCGYRDHVVRAGKVSRVYSVHGVEFTVPRRLSAKVAA